MSADFLSVENLKVNFTTDAGVVNAVKGIDFKIPKGKTVGLVGESGSGKSVTSLSIMGLLPNPANIPAGKILFQGDNLLELPEHEMRKVRGNKISMIFQEPMTSLNPVFTIGDQISEALRLHQGLNKREALERSIDLLDKVGIPNPSTRVHTYPHVMSGGQRQRVMIAMAIACEPDLLIADEPTTALDVTIQKQILDLLASLQDQYKMSILFITHDLAVVGDIADEVLVMYRGNIVEKGTAKDIFTASKHPYTKGLMSCRPSLDRSPARLPMVSDYMDESGVAKDFDIKTLGEKKAKPESKDVLLEVKNLKTHFVTKRSFFGKKLNVIKAVDDVSFKISKGKTLGLVGESGCGKTTLGRSILRLIEPTSGEVIFDKQNVTALDRPSMRALRRRMQIIFQDPYASLNPRMTIGAALMEPMQIHKLGAGKKERQQRAEELMQKVGLEPRFLARYPHEFSGGQRQRICIARALAVEPEFIICDESVSALDVSIQAQILNLLLDLQDEMGLTYIFISHDLAVVKFFSDELIVMNEGKIVEKASSESIYQNPTQEYTRQLLSSIPKGIS